MRDEEKNFIMIKGSSLQEDVTILSVYGYNKRASKYVRQKPSELQKEIDESVLQLDTSTPL
jgi:hypothetical protein